MFPGPVCWPGCLGLAAGLLLPLTPRSGVASPVNCSRRQGCPAPAVRCSSVSPRRPAGGCTSFHRSRFARRGLRQARHQPGQGREVLRRRRLGEHPPPAAASPGWAPVVWSPASRARTLPAACSSCSPRPAGTRSPRRGQGRVVRQLQQETGLSSAEYSVFVSFFEASGGWLRGLRLRVVAGWEEIRLTHRISRVAVRGPVAREPWTPAVCLSCSLGRPGVRSPRCGQGWGRHAGRPAVAFDPSWACTASTVNRLDRRHRTTGACRRCGP